jgi:hypothetical protein
MLVCVAHLCPTQLIYAFMLYGTVLAAPPVLCVRANLRPVLCVCLGKV